MSNPAGQQLHAQCHQMHGSWLQPVLNSIQYKDDEDLSIVISGFVIPDLVRNPCVITQGDASMHNAIGYMDPGFRQDDEWRVNPAVILEFRRDIQNPCVTMQGDAPMHGTIG